MNRLLIIVMVLFASGALANDQDLRECEVLVANESIALGFTTIAGCVKYAEAAETSDDLQYAQFGATSLMLRNGEYFRSSDGGNAWKSFQPFSSKQEINTLNTLQPIPQIDEAEIAKSPLFEKEVTADSQVTHVPMAMNPSVSSLEPSAAVEVKTSAMLEEGGVESDAVSGTSSAPIAAIEDPANSVATGIGRGMGITATDASAEGATSTLALTSWLVQIIVTPEIASIDQGQQDQYLFGVTGLCRNGLADDAPIAVCPVDEVFWTVNNENASINSATGALRGNKMGSIAVTATKGILSNTVALNIGPLSESSLDMAAPILNPVTPANASTEDSAPIIDPPTIDPENTDESLGPAS